jgi:hypothetical protein
VYTVLPVVTILAATFDLKALGILNSYLYHLFMLS